MNATLNAEHFQNYYGRLAASVEIPGFTYPVKTHFLSVLDNYYWSFKLLIHFFYDEFQNQLSKELGIHNTTVEENGKPFWNPQLVAKVIKWIDSNKPPGAILCFVSGWQDIIDVSKQFYFCLEG